MSDRAVAVLGLGTMGAGMANNLLKGGFKVSVYNRTAEKAKPLVEAGARFANTPARATEGAEVIISMLADDVASRDTWLGKDGALAAAVSGSILVESSTVSPEWIEELANAAAGQGVEVIDAPVTGSRMQAEAGQLTFLVGGSDALLARVTPVLKAMSKEIVHLGPIGSGAKMKLINNFLCGVQVASLAEGLAWIERSGLDVEKSLNVLKRGAPGSPLLSAICARMTDHDYSVNFLLKLMAKDLRYAEMEASRCDVDLKTAIAARGLFEAAMQSGFGDKDMASVIEPLRQR
jgi:3-hydroxyisobutyrate dehydrogenase